MWHWLRLSIRYRLTDVEDMAPAAEVYSSATRLRALGVFSARGLSFFIRFGIDAEVPVSEMRQEKAASLQDDYPSSCGTGIAVACAIHVSKNQSLAQSFEWFVWHARACTPIVTLLDAHSQPSGEGSAACGILIPKAPRLGLVS